MRSHARKILRTHTYTFILMRMHRQKLSSDPFKRATLNKSPSMNIYHQTRCVTRYRFRIRVVGSSEDESQRLLRTCRATIDSTCYDYASMQIIATPGLSGSLPSDCPTHDNFSQALCFGNRSQGFPGKRSYILK